MVIYFFFGVLLIGFLAIVFFLVGLALGVGFFFLGS
jgi:hypothetical protein